MATTGSGGTAEHDLDHILSETASALALEPSDAAAHVRRGDALKSLGRMAEAVGSYDRALAIEPTHAGALNNRGLALQELRRFPEALRSLDAAARLFPAHPEIRFNRAFLLLLLGRFREGWQEYEWRRKRDGWVEPKFRLPEWRGESIAGKRVFLYSEQAYGDAIQFGRLAGLVNEQAGAEVMLGAPAGLEALLRRLDADVTIIRSGERLPRFDVQLPLMSAPHILDFAPHRSPPRVPYLAADPALVEKWSQRLPTGGLRIGIAWQGSIKTAGDRGRAVPLGCFAPLAAIPGVRLISLQKGEGSRQLADLPPGMPVEDLGPGFDSGPDLFTDTAAVMMHLDLIVSCDTAVAHLAGALARPVWLALRHVPDWRWLAEGDTSPWYPTARLFRQPSPGDWASVFADMAERLDRRRSLP